MMSICLWHRNGSSRRRNKLKAMHLGFKKLAVTSPGGECGVTLHLIGHTNGVLLHATEYQLDLDRAATQALVAMLQEALANKHYVHRSVSKPD